MVKAYIASTQHSTEVRAAAAKVVGSGCQNNPKAQTLALKEGVSTSSSPPSLYM